MLANLLLLILAGLSATPSQITEGTSKMPAILLPRFAEFKVEKVFNGKPAPPVLLRPEERRFRTVLREGANAGPNFAGHYTIVEWGCGTECWQAAVVDAETGRVYPSPLKGSIGYFRSSWLHFQLRSRLLVACDNCRKWASEQCDQRYFVWNGDGFTEIKRAPGSDSHSH
jgi:hypothetical protein